MPQILKPHGNTYPFIDGCYHGRTLTVRDGQNVVEVIKPRRREICFDLDLPLVPQRLETQTYHRTKIWVRLAKAKHDNRERIRVYEAFVFAGMTGDEAAKELRYMLLRRPVNRPLYKSG